MYETGLGVGGVDVQIFTDGSKDPNSGKEGCGVYVVDPQTLTRICPCSDSAAGFDCVNEILICIYRAENMGCEVGFCRYRGKSIKRECIWRITEEMR